VNVANPETFRRLSRAPYLTADIPGTGGVLKQRPEDFVVEEVPLYEPAGEGNHTYLTIEKHGLSTFEAIQRVAQALGISPSTVGYAGLKDTRAVTVQRISVEGVDRNDALELSIPRMRVLAADYHHNKLRIGHLAGNRFRVHIRRPEAGAHAHASATIERLSRLGVPNFFGMQRFSARRNAHVIGRAMLLHDWEGAARAYLGNPLPFEVDALREARQAFDEGDFNLARRLFPMPRFREERKVLGALVRGISWQAAFGEMHSRMRRLFTSAYQSALFNRVLARRMPDIGTMLDGDVAVKHQGGAAFIVESAAVEQPRADAFEVSPSGPLYGRSMLRAQGEPGEAEAAILREEGFDPNTMASVFRDLRGQRRHLRIPLAEPHLETLDNDDLLVSFRLPSGSYATVVLDEIMKNDPFGLLDGDGPDDDEND